MTRARTPLTLALLALTALAGLLAFAPSSAHAQLTAGSNSPLNDATLEVYGSTGARKIGVRGVRAVADKDLTTIPTSVTAGVWYIAQWAPFENRLARWTGVCASPGCWTYADPPVGGNTVWVVDEAALYVYDAGTAAWVEQAGGGGGSGDVVGPASATDNAVARYDGTTGELIQNSAVTIADTTGSITLPAGGTVDGRDVSVDGAALDALDAANSLDVTLAGAPTYLSLGGQTLTLSLINLASASHVTGTLPVANGGTAATTASGAVDSLFGAASSGTGGACRVGSCTLTTPTFSGTAVGAITGNAGTVTHQDAGGDTTTFPALATSATGALGPTTDAGLSYNATTNILTASGGIAGLVIGTDVQAFDAELSTLAGSTAAFLTLSDDASVSAIVDTIFGASSSGTGGACRVNSCTLTTPTIASLANATHTHQNAAGGGTLDAAAIAAGTMATARLGSGSATSSTFLRGDSTWQTIPGGGDALTSSPLSQFAATTSAQLAGVLSDEVGSSGGFVRENGSITGNAATVTTNANLTGPITSSGNATTIADGELSAIAGLTSAADRLPYYTGSGTGALATYTAAGRALDDDADAPAQRTTLGLGGLATLSAVGASEITNGAVAFADRADIATDRLVGRDTAATGSEEALTVGGGVEFTGSGGIQRSALSGAVTASAGSGTTSYGDGEISSLAGLTSAADALPYYTGSGTASTTTMTSAARALLDDTTAAAGLATLGGLPLAGGTLTGPVLTDRGTFTYSATPTLDVSANANWDLTDDLDGNMAITLSSGVTRMSGLIGVRQDPTGARTVSLTATGATMVDMGGAIASAADTYSVIAYEFRTIDGVLVCLYSMAPSAGGGDAELEALAALTSAADRLPYFTGSGTAALATFTAAGRALIDDADASAQRTTLGLGTLATQSGTFSGTSSGTNTGDQTTVSGNAGTVTHADAGGDTTTFVSLGTAATGSLAPATDAELTYNATTNELSTTTFIGALTGNASTASTATTVTDEAITVAKIADGTDGELLTWDATGEAATVAVGTSGHVLTSNGTGAAPTFQAAGSGSGDVVGPASATDNAVARYDTTTGKLLQDSTVTVDDSGNVALAAGDTVDGRELSTDGAALDALDAATSGTNTGDAYEADLANALVPKFNGATVSSTRVTDRTTAVYVGYVAKATTVDNVTCILEVVGAGTQVAEVAAASSSTYPTGAALNLTKIVADGTVTDLTTGTGQKKNTTAFNGGAGTAVSAGTYLWALFRTAMATTQPGMAAIPNMSAQNTGNSVYVDGLGALTSWTGPTSFALSTSNSTASPLCWIVKH